MRLWIDTDVGTNPDDAVALLCAVGHPDVDLVGVSTVDGDTEWRVGVARTLVDAPVVSGARLAPADLTEAGAEAMLAIGPLTNVARLLATGGLPPRVGVMGGTLRPVRHRGAEREIEHNFGADPEAAHIAVERALAMLLCPLDVTVRMRPSDDDFRRLVDAAPGLGPMFTDWVDHQRAVGVPEDDAAVRLHDPLAFLALVGEPIVAIERRLLVVDDEGRIYEDKSRGRAVEVVTDVDVADAIDRIIALVAQARRTAQ